MNGLRLTEFDAAQFVDVVSIGAGDGRVSAALSSRNKENVAQATAALSAFASFARLPPPPDVIAAYLQYRPQAEHLFSPLWLSEQHPDIVLAALDALTAVARYARKGDAPKDPVAKARAIVKDIVKGRAPTILHVVQGGNRRLLRGVLVLLEVVASSNPILAKEVVNRFDLGSEFLTTKLNIAYSPTCRTAYLCFLTTLLKSGDRDIALHLASRGRASVLTGVSGVATRTSVILQERETHFRVHGTKRPGQRDLTIVTSEDIARKRTLAELSVSARFLETVCARLLHSPNDIVVRSILESQILERLARIAVTDIDKGYGYKDTYYAPVKHAQLQIKRIAVQSFKRAVQDTRATPHICRAIAAVQHAESLVALNFIAALVVEFPRLASLLLVRGPYLHVKPEPTQKWLADATVIMACVRNLQKPVATFSRLLFFEKTLAHESALVQHIGSLVLAMLCRVVLRSGHSGPSSDAILPPVRLIDKMLKTPWKDGAAPHILAYYRTIFAREFEETKTDAVRAAVEACGTNIVATEQTVLASLSAAPLASLTTIFQCKLLLSLLRTLMEPDHDATDITKCWNLVHRILMATGLFPAEAEHEITIWLAALRSLKNDVEICLKGLHDMVFLAWRQPYGLYDDIAEATSPSGETQKALGREVSLLSAAAVRRLCKVNPADTDHQQKWMEAPFERYLAFALEALVSWDLVVGRQSAKMLLQLKLGASAGSVISLLGSSVVDQTQQLQSASRNLHLLVQSNAIAPIAQLRLVCAVADLLLDLCGKARVSLAEVRYRWAAFCSTAGRHSELVAVGRKFPPSPSATNDACRQQEVPPHVYRLLRMLEMTVSANRSDRVCSLIEDEKLSSKVRGDLTVTDQSILLSTALRGRHFRTGGVEALSHATDLLLICKEGSIPGSIEAQALCNIILYILRSSTQIHPAYITRLLSTVTRNLAAFDTQRPVRLQEIWGRSCLQILEAVIMHRDPAPRALIVNSIAQMETVKRQKLARLAPLAWKSFLTILRNIPVLVQSTLYSIESTNWCDICAHCRAYVPILSFLSTPTKFTRERLTSGMSGFYLSRIALDTAWGASEPEGFCEVLPYAFDFGRHIATLRKTDETISELAQRFQRPESSGSSVLWAIVTGMLCPHAQSMRGRGQLLKSYLGLLGVMLDFFHEQHRTYCPRRVQFGPIHAMRNLLVNCSREKVLEEVVGLGDSDVVSSRLIVFTRDVLRSTATPVLNRLAEETGKQGKMELVGDSDDMCDLSLVLEFFEAVMSLVNVPDDLLRQALNSFGALSSFVLNLTVLADREGSRRSSVWRELVLSFVRVVGKILRAISHWDGDVRLHGTLCQLGALLCAPEFGYQGSMSGFDGTVRATMAQLRVCLGKCDSDDFPSVTGWRSGYFAPLAVNVVPMLDPGRLHATFMYIMRTNNAQEEAVPIALEDSAAQGARIVPYDPSVALQVLRKAADYACNYNTLAALDLGRVANNGLLKVAISAIASPNLELRVEGYAALHSLSKAVGAERSNARESAASLYRDRRQLAFVLQLLKDSIPDATRQVLPLFASWFSHMMHIVLHPTHGAYKSITRFLLRRPVLDTNDCDGVVHLLHSTEVGAQVKSTRLLAMQVLIEGMWSRNDHLVARRRKIYESVLLLAGSSLGAETAVRDAAMRLLTDVPKRFPRGQVSYQLLRAHGFASWIVPQRCDHSEYRGVHIKLRLRALAAVASSVPESDDVYHYAECLSNALSALVRALSVCVQGFPRHHDVVSVIDAAVAVSNLAPNVRQVLTFEHEFVTRGLCFAEMSDKERKKLKKVFSLTMTHHESSTVGFDVLETLWEYLEDLHSERDEMHVDEKLGTRVIVESFISESIVAKSTERQLTRDQVENSCFYAARTLRHEDVTVWSMVTGVALLSSCGGTDARSLVSRIADRIPGEAPKNLGGLDHARFSNVLTEHSLDLASALVCFGTKLRLTPRHGDVFTVEDVKCKAVREKMNKRDGDVDEVCERDAKRICR